MCVCVCVCVCIFFLNTKGRVGDYFVFTCVPNWHWKKLLWRMCGCSFWRLMYLSTFSAVHVNSLQLGRVGFSLQRLPFLWSTGSRCMGLSGFGSWALECWLGRGGHGLSCAVARGLFLDQGLKQCPLRNKGLLNHWTTRKAHGCSSELSTYKSLIW